MILGVVLSAVLHVVLPLVAAGGLVLLVVGRRGRRFLRILLLEQPGRTPRPRGSRRVRAGSYLAVLLGALCGVKAAETAATSTSQGWLVWTMAALAGVLVVGGAIGLFVAGRRRASAGDRARSTVSGP